MKEHNNRQIADKYAEFITSKALRILVAEKVREYLGDRTLNVFDGAVGSGQLEQYIQVKSITGVDIQRQAIDAFKENYGDRATGIVSSLFDVIDDIPDDFDCVVMNPPFSLKMEAVVTGMPYVKKTGLLDECFYVLSSMKARYSFFICFPGVGYRRTEQKMRSYFGNTVAELIAVDNGFDDTGISTLLVVIDREKTDDNVSVARYDCKKVQYTIPSKKEKLDIENWNVAREEIAREEIDIVALTRELRSVQSRNRRLIKEFDELVLSLMTDEQRNAL
ncbi:methyltransferase [Providencia rettgeri]